MIDSFQRWARYHELRNLTSHTYNPVAADEILAECQNFYQDVKELLYRLEVKNDQSN